MTVFATFLVSLIGIMVGLIMGLTGAGGGMLAVPALVYSQGWSMQQAMPVALLAVSLGALIGAIDGLRRRQVRYKAALLMALTGAPMTSIGVFVASRMSQQFLMLAFSAVLIIVVTRLVLQAHKGISVGASAAVRADAMAKVNQLTGKFDWSWATAAIIGLIGACAGFATGLLGVGGGFIIVPLLRHFTNLNMQSAAATSLMVIALVGTVAVTSAVAHGIHLPLLFSILFATASVTGVLLGRKLANRLDSTTVQFIFAAMLAAVAISFLMKAFA